MQSLYVVTIDTQKHNARLEGVLLKKRFYCPIEKNKWFEKWQMIFYRPHYICFCKLVTIKNVDWLYPIFIHITIVIIILMVIVIALYLHVSLEDKCVEQPGKGKADGHVKQI